MKTIQFSLEDVLATPQGQEIVTSLLREAAEPIFKRLLNEEHIVSNLVWHLVNHYISDQFKLEQLGAKVAKAVEEKMKAPEGCIPYFNQNKVLQHYVDCAVTENVPLIKEQVTRYLGDDTNYERVEYQLGYVLTQALAKGLKDA